MSDCEQLKSASSDALQQKCGVSVNGVARIGLSFSSSDIFYHTQIHTYFRLNLEAHKQCQMQYDVGAYDELVKCASIFRARVRDSVLCAERTFFANLVMRFISHNMCTLKCTETMFIVSVHAENYGANECINYQPLDQFSIYFSYDFPLLLFMMIMMIVMIMRQLDCSKFTMMMSACLWS